jgi:hypothetical protein
VIRRLREGFFVYFRGPIGKAVFFDVLTLSFLGTPKRFIGTPPGPRGGEEEERRRRRRGGEEERRTHFIRKG